MLQFLIRWHWPSHNPPQVHSCLNSLSTQLDHRLITVPLWTWLSQKCLLSWTLVIQLHWIDVKFVDLLEHHLFCSLFPIFFDTYHPSLAILVIPVPTAIQEPWWTLAFNASKCDVMAFLSPLWTHNYLQVLIHIVFTFLTFSSDLLLKYDLNSTRQNTWPILFCWCL